MVTLDRPMEDTAKGRGTYLMGSLSIVLQGMLDQIYPSLKPDGSFPRLRPYLYVHAQPSTSSGHHGGWIHEKPVPKNTCITRFTIHIVATRSLVTELATEHGVGLLATNVKFVPNTKVRQQQ